MNNVQVNGFTMPGDTFPPRHPPKNVIIFGPGLRRHAETNDLVITKPGILRFKSPNMYWIDCTPTTYIPRRGDLVIGVVARKSGDAYKVDIGAAEQASLSCFAFEGATKKQKPDIRLGDVVYARVLTAHAETEPDLVCVDKYFKASHMGKLPSTGFLINVPISLCYKILSAEIDLLHCIGKKTVFEVAIGLNGKVWINARTPAVVMKIMKVFQIADLHTNKSVNDICKRVRMT